MLTELPPNVLKYLILRPNSARVSGRAATPAIGMPLPMGLPITARSGTMPWRWKPHMAAPVRPKPGWTSSAMYRPPASCTASSTGFRHPAGSGWIPSEENRLSAMNAASRTPCRFMSAMVSCTRSANEWTVSWAAGGATVHTARPSGTAGPRLGDISAAAVVTPWYALAVMTVPSPPVKKRAMRRARSTASLPVQVNMTLPSSAGYVASSRSA